MKKISDRYKYLKIAGMILISILPTILASYLFLDMDNKSSAELTINSLYTMGSDYNRQINLWIDEIVYDLNFIAFSEPVRTLDVGCVKNTIDYVKVNKDLYKEIYILDTDANIVYGQIDNLEDFGQKTWVTNSLKGAVDTSDVLFHRNSAVIEIAVPIFNKEKIVGAICAKVKLDHLNDIMANSILIDETAKSYIVNKDGVFITESRYYPDAVGKKKIDVDRVKLNIDYARELSYTDYRGKDVYGIYFDIPYNNWTLIVEKDKDVVEKNNKNIMKIGQYLTTFEIFAIAIIQKVLNKELNNVLGTDINLD